MRPPRRDWQEGLDVCKLPCAAKARMLAIPGSVGLSEEDMG